MPLDVHIPIALQTLLVVILVLLPAKIYGTTLWHLLIKKFASNNGRASPTQKAKFRVGENGNLKQTLSVRARHEGQHKDLQVYKNLYFKLHNLEQFSEVLLQSRDVLISLLSETLADALNDSQTGILSVEDYTQEGLACFLKNQNGRITSEWESYVARRRAGSPAELFENKEEALWWLKQIAPVKYVDGAWLGHINKITTPFALRRATKDAWQVMSEELGDGNREMNHVYIYRELMREIDAGLPEADNADFIHPRHHLDQECVWKAAVAQLLISLFPHEFLPEILGFNLHFEGLTMETMKAAKEVAEFGLNAYYFILHISIDNADSGHTAIAGQAVNKYMEEVLKAGGKAAAEQSWKRIQAGFLLSKGLTGIPVCQSRRKPESDAFPSTALEAEVTRVFKSKTPVAYKLHCNSRIMLGGRKLDDWFDPQAFAGKQWQMDFLNTLGNFKPWVRKGDSSKSRLIEELSWGGKMFGSFTQNEVDVVKRWIDSLKATDPRLYWSFVGRTEISSLEVLQRQDIRVDYPVLTRKAAIDSTIRQYTSIQLQSLYCQSSVNDPSNPVLSILLPLWFTSPCLLESFVCIPAKTTTSIASSIVRLLRAQCGFDAEGPIVAGMDEVRRTDSTGLVELGLEMIKSLDLPTPTCLKDVLETWPSEFALKMLELSMMPMANMGLLIGLASAFVDLHEAMTTSPLFSAASKVVLTEIVLRERDNLGTCFDSIKDDKVHCLDFDRGYVLGRTEIRHCFSQNRDSEDNGPSSVLR